VTLEKLPEAHANTLLTASENAPILAVALSDTGTTRSTYSAKS